MFEGVCNATNLTIDKTLFLTYICYPELCPSSDPTYLPFFVPLLLQNNVAMLLETNYRERLHMVTNEVKRRLDYQIALQHLNRRMQQEHMINWVEKNVIGSITPQQVSPSLFFNEKAKA